MSIVLTALEPVWRVLAVGLLLGAGLPAVFSLGVRAMAGTGGVDAEPRPAGPGAKVAAYLCFALVALAVVAGLLMLTASDWVLGVLGLE